MSAHSIVRKSAIVAAPALLVGVGVFTPVVAQAVPASEAGASANAVSAARGSALDQHSVGQQWDESFNLHYLDRKEINEGTATVHYEVTNGHMAGAGGTGDITVLPDQRIDPRFDPDSPHALMSFTFKITYADGKFATFVGQYSASDSGAVHSVTMSDWSFDPNEYKPFARSAWGTSHWDTGVVSIGVDPK